MTFFTHQLPTFTLMGPSVSGVPKMGEISLRTKLFIKFWTFPKLLPYDRD